jgi:hypothetical protein
VHRPHSFLSAGGNNLQHVLQERAQLANSGRASGFASCARSCKGAEEKGTPRKAGFLGDCDHRLRNITYIMSSMPAPGIGGAFSSFGSSAIIASVVRMSPATDAAFCSAERVTLVGSRTPNLTMSPNSPVAAL